MKFGNTATSAPKIQALPHTTEASVKNVKMSHLLIGTWKAALSLDAPVLDPVEYGYMRQTFQDVASNNCTRWCYIGTR